MHLNRFEFIWIHLNSTFPPNFKRIASNKKLVRITSSDSLADHQNQIHPVDTLNQSFKLRFSIRLSDCRCELSLMKVTSKVFALKALMMESGLQLKPKDSQNFGGHESWGFLNPKASPSFRGNPNASLESFKWKAFGWKLQDTHTHWS